MSLANVEGDNTHRSMRYRGGSVRFDEELQVTGRRSDRIDALSQDIRKWEDTRLPRALTRCEHAAIQRGGYSTTSSAFLVMVRIALPRVYKR